WKAPAFDAYTAEGSTGVGRGRRGDVVSLAIQDRAETLVASSRQHTLKRAQAPRAASLEECALGLHHGNQRGNDVQDAKTKLVSGPVDRRERVRTLPYANFFWQVFPARVESHAKRVSFGADSSEQTVGKVGHGDF